MYLFYCLFYKVDYFMVYSMVFRAPLGPPQENIGILCEFPATEISRTSCISLFTPLVLAPVEAVKLTVTRAMLINSFTVQSPNVTYTDTHIESKYTCVSRPAPLSFSYWRHFMFPRYANTELRSEDRGDGSPAWTIYPVESTFQFKTDRRIPKLGYVSFRNPTS